MKKGWIFVGIIFVIVLCFILIKFVYFFPTQVKIMDLEGNPIADTNVRISYSCQLAVPDVGGGEHFRGFGYREGISDSDGIIHFNSLNKKFLYSNFPFFMFNCRKDVSVLKEGYCPNHEITSRRCLGKNDTETLLSKNEISKLPVFFTKAISWFKGEAVLVLKKIDDYQPIISNLSCKIFEEKCLKYDEFNSLLANKDPSICTKTFISNEEKQNLITSCEQGAFRTVNDPEQISIPECLDKYKSSNEYSFIWNDLNTECYTEIAFVKKDPSICSNVQDTEMQRRCYEYLALDLKDIALCKNGGNELVFENCKFDVIKKLGDVSKCSLLNSQEINDLCEVYFG